MKIKTKKLRFYYFDSLYFKIIRHIQKDSCPKSLKHDFENKLDVQVIKYFVVNKNSANL